MISILAVSFIVISDFSSASASGSVNTESIIIGDLLCLFGVFILAGTNVYEEWLIRKNFKIYDILAVMAPVGFVFALFDAWALGEISLISDMKQEHIVQSCIFYFGFALSNFLLYNFIPHFVCKAGATLMNIGNLTAPVYSMIFDIILFDGTLKWFYLVGFTFQILSIIIFSMKDPHYPLQVDSSGKLSFLSVIVDPSLRQTNVKTIRIDRDYIEFCESRDNLNENDKCASLLSC